jgi:hypothetical protein
MSVVTDFALRRSVSVSTARERSRFVGLVLVWALVLGNAAAIVFLWVHGGNLHNKTTGEALTSVARITGLLSAYLALVQVVLLARLPALERAPTRTRLPRSRWGRRA